MKKLSILFILTLIVLKGFSQAVDDTTTLASPTLATNAIIYQSTLGNFLTGNNGTYEITDVYQKYSLSGYKQITGLNLDTFSSWVDEVYIFYGYASFGSSPGYVKSQLFTVTPNDTTANYNGTTSIFEGGNSPNPNGAFATSDSLSMVDLPKPVSTFQMVGFKFPAPVKITTDSFFASVHLSQAVGDTLAIGSSLTASSAQVPFHHSSWFHSALVDYYDYYTFFTIYATAADIDLAIEPRVIYEVSTGVNNVDNSIFVMTFPNPASNQLYIGYDLPNNEKINVTLTDMLGRVVSEIGTKDMAKGTHTESFDVSKLASGMYIYKIETNNGYKTGKVYVSH